MCPFPQVHATPGSLESRKNLRQALDASLKAAPPSADSAAAAAVRRRVLEGDAKHALALPRPGSQGAEQDPHQLPAPGQLLSEAMEAYSAAAGGTVVVAAAADGGNIENGHAAGEAALRLALLCNHLLRVWLAPQAFRMAVLIPVGDAGRLAEAVGLLA